MHATNKACAQCKTQRCNKESTLLQIGAQYCRIKNKLSPIMETITSPDIANVTAFLTEKK